MNKYIGHEQQLYGVREMRLVGGKADGMRILSVKNGMGLEPGNCLPDGRNVMREKGILEILKPDEEKVHHIKFEFEER